MTEMKLIDSTVVYLPEVKAVNHWKKFPDIYKFDSLLAHLFVLSAAAVFGVLTLCGWWANRKATQTVSALEQRMRLLGGEVIQQLRKNAQVKTTCSRKNDPSHFWKCDKVRPGYHTDIRIRKY